MCNEKTIDETELETVAGGFCATTPVITWPRPMPFPVLPFPFPRVPCPPFGPIVLF
jgi:hypothetical protein